MKRRVPLLWLVTCCALALGTLPAAAGSASAKTVTIGVVAPIDAGLTSFGHGIRDSVRLAVQEANADELIPGWKVRVRSLDDSSDPAKGAKAAARLAADPSVAAVIGPYNSGVAEGMLPVLAKRGVALVSPSNTLTSLTLGDDPAQPRRPWKNYFRVVGPDSLQAVFLAERARGLGFTNAAVVSETKAVSKGLADIFAEAFKAEGGTVSVQQIVPDGATNFDAFLSAAAGATPDLLFFGGEYQVAATLRDAATTAGVTVPLMGGDGMNDAEYIMTAGASAAGSYASSVGAPLADAPGAASFIAAYDDAGFSSEPTNFGPYAYDAANSVLAALRTLLQGKSALPKNIRSRVVARLQTTDRYGVTGPIAFDAYGDTRDPVFTLYRVEGSPLAWTPVRSP